MAFDYAVLKDPFSFKNITTTTTEAALVKTGAGVLHAIVRLSPRGFMFVRPGRAIIQ